MERDRRKYNLRYLWEKIMTEAQIKRRYYDNHKAEIKEYMKKYYQENKERYKENQKKYYYSHREEIAKKSQNKYREKCGLNVLT